MMPKPITTLNVLRLIRKILPATYWLPLSATPEIFS